LLTWRAAASTTPQTTTLLCANAGSGAVPHSAEANRPANCKRDVLFFMGCLRTRASTRSSCERDE
jgi:hypothetical protein